MPDAVQAYEVEQAKLKAEYDGKDIHVTVPQEAEVNPEVYKDVEPMLFRGFLTVAANINDVHFVFKSLNHHEFDLLRFSGSLKEDQASDEFWDTFLAYGVFMVAGVNILPEREKWLPKIASTFTAFPKEARTNIIRHVSEVNRRASNAVGLTEAYAMETVSRYRWLQLKGLDLTGTSVSGIDGTHRLGLNWAQQLWRAINHAEDRNEQQEREWENAKFIGSCFAGKGISKVYAQDSDRRRKDKEERQSRKDQILREIILGEKPDPKLLKIPGAVMSAPRTTKELAEQLEKDLRGDKDWHDNVIEAHETRVKQQYRQRQAQLEVVAQESAVQFGDRNVIGGADLQGLSPQEVQMRVARSKQLLAQEAARAQVHPEVAEKTQNFLEKWGVIAPDVEVEVSTTDRDISGAVTLPQTTRTPTTPFRRK